MIATAKGLVRSGTALQRDQWVTKDQNPPVNTESAKRYSTCHRAAPEGCQMSHGLFCQERWGRELSSRELLQGNLPSWFCSHLGSTGEWMGWAAETGQWRSVNNNRVWVMCAVRPDLPCSLSCSHHEAISRMKLWAGRGELLSNYENVYGKGIFTKAC